MSPVRTTSEGNLKTQATITSHFGFVYEEILAGKSNDQREVIVLKASFSMQSQRCQISPV